MQEQIKKLQGEIKQIGAPKKKVEQQPKQPKTLVEKFREEYLKSGKAMSAIRKDKGSVDEKLNSFASHLKQVEKQPKAAVKKVSVAPESNWECSLHFIKNCSSCRDTFGEQISDDEDDWMSATLHFPKQVGANVYEPKIDDYTVVDPRQGYFILTSAKADPFGRDIQVLGDIKSRQKVIWTEKSTRTVKSLTEQFIEQPDFIRE
jgi:peptidyl-prolyl cis-trans isomerase SDCCAG10